MSPHTFGGTYMRDDVVVPRPRTGRTPVRNIRVAEQLWRDAQAKAEAEGRTLTEVLATYLTRYVATPPRKQRDRDQ